MRSRAVSALLFGWLAAVGADFFLHGGLMPDLYKHKSPFLLPPQLAFDRLPHGYVAILLVIGYLVWLIQRTGATSPIGGLCTGLALGVVVFGAFLIGLFSITTIPLDLALSWFVAQSVELAVSGAVIAWTLSARRLRGPGVLSVFLVVLGFVAAIALQNV
jgi:hypothetical protein